MDKQPMVSVVITTKNEEKNIENCLKSIKSQTYPRDRIEIIVVDNNSSDKTKEIARQYTDLVLDKGPERSAQRNNGVSRAQGAHILYLDADMILSPGVVKECVEHCAQNPDILGLYIPEIIMGESFWCKVRRFERSFYNGTVIDCVRFIKKEAFESVGGFDETMTGPEDWDFDKKVRAIGKVDLIKTSIYHNESDFNLKKYLRKKVYYSKSFEKYIQKWGANDPDIKKQLGAFYRFFRVFTENGKWYTFILHPILACSILFLKAFLGLFIIKNKVVKNKVASRS